MNYQEASKMRATIFLKVSLTVGWSIIIVRILTKSAAGWTTWTWNRIAMCLFFSAVIVAMVYNAAVCIMGYRKEEKPDG